MPKHLLPQAKKAADSSARMGGQASEEVV